jgi:ribonuclease T2
MRAFLIWCLLALPSLARSDVAGQFDYYILSLSWSPNWCALEGNARQSVQCDASQKHGWILHGLWPQYNKGYPAFCQTAERAPSRQMTSAMADIMGTPGLAWHQWKKHGSCSGLSAANYFALARQAYNNINRPEVFRKLDRTITLPAGLIESAFTRANYGLDPDEITITCKSGHVQEARICLSKTLEPVICGPDVIRDCALRAAIFEPIR